MDTLDQLEYLRNGQKTGSLLIKFDIKTAYCNLQDGDIRYIFFAGCKGTEALSLLQQELIQNSTTVRFQFNESPITMIDESLPSTEAIITQLSDKTSVLINSDLAVTPAAENIKHPPIANEPQSSNNVPNNNELTDVIKSKIESIVIELVGPMGTIICTDAFKSTDSLDAAVAVIASDLAALDMKQAFTNRIQAISINDAA